MTTSIYDFIDPIDYLSNVFSQMKKEKHGFSLRLLSKKFGFSSPNILSMILRRERAITCELGKQIGAYLALGASEQKYLDLLILKVKAKTEQEEKIFKDLLEDELTRRKLNEMDLDQFQVIAKWYHFVIYEMLSLDCFKGQTLDLDGLFLRLNGEVAKTDILKAIERLERVGLVARRSGGYVQAEDGTLSTPDNIANIALKEHHFEMITKSLKALKEQDVQQRHISGSTIALSKSDLEDYKKAIRDLEFKLLNKGNSSESKDSVYQLNVQFFEVARG